MSEKGPSHPSGPGREAAPDEHVLDWLGEDEPQVEHPADCPITETSLGPDHDCLLGRIVRYAGLNESLTFEPTPGRHVIRAWANQSTDYRTYGEWEYGIDPIPPKPDLAYASLLDLVQEVASCGVEHEAPTYVTVQIARVTWDELAQYRTQRPDV